MKKAILLLFLFTTTLFYAQQMELRDQAAIEEACKSAMEEFLKMNYNEAFLIMKAFSAVSDDSFEKLRTQSVEQSAFAIKKYGQPLDYTKIKERELTGVLKEITYIVRHEKYGLRFQFQLYRGKDNLWRLTNFLWDDELKKLIKE